MMNVTGIYLGMADIHHEGNVSVNGTMGIENNSALNTAINVFILAVLFTSMISIGCTMEAYKIKNYLFNPKGAVIAMLSQFGIMPLTAFGLAKILKLDPIKALTVLICGCSPGGNLSNIFSLAINGDMNLSIVMTTCSNIAAMVMMPLLLYIYSQGFPGLERAVPYLGIIVTLILTLVPCAIGIAINHYKPHYSAVVKKVGFSILIICSIIVFTLSAISVKDVFWMIIKPDVLCAGALLPLFGFILGYAISAICRLSPQCSRTISMETGCQNVNLCGAILKVAFPPNVIGAMFLFPLVYIIFQCSEALFVILCFRCYQKFKSPPQGTKIYSNEDIYQDSVKGLHQTIED
ncbi:Sodium/bile acid cotransporter [Channa argus]|uniref:Hepatic sodium/bile acid cotransporter n=1 Tax=Channa argus TaxID=215402 RepID=A0A6G1QFU9_CHAAH|nr:Sodium/bile acid cotransporter [Channa argus]